MDFDQCPCSGRNLSRLVKPAIMALLLKERLHGYVLIQRLEDLAMFRDQVPDAGGLYKALKELEETGMVASVIEEADRGIGRRVFGLTEDGKICAKKWAKSLSDYRQALDELISLLK